MYVALGDSLTAGVGASKRELAYPNQLSQRLANQKGESVELYNFGIPGATAADVVSRELPELENLKGANIVTIFIGVNDILNRTPLDQFQSEISQITDVALSHSQHVYLVTIPTIGSRALFLPPYRLYFGWQTRRYNEASLEALKGKSVTILDLYNFNKQAEKENEFYSLDLFHPSDIGYTLWTNFFYGALQ